MPGSCECKTKLSISVLSLSRKFSMSTYLPLRVVGMDVELLGVSFSNSVQIRTHLQKFKLHLVLSWYADFVCSYFFLHEL